MVYICFKSTIVAEKLTLVRFVTREEANTQYGSLLRTPADLMLKTNMKTCLGRVNFHAVFQVKESRSSNKFLNSVPDFILGNRIQNLLFYFSAHTHTWTHIYCHLLLCTVSISNVGDYCSQLMTIVCRKKTICVS